jgi:heme/copper-type cytochrome/quinol oxidase subunit 3
MSVRRVVDVSHLPRHGLDYQECIWWGNLLLIAIETTMFGLLAASYFYIFLYTSPWPPPRTAPPSTLFTAPDLLPGTITVILLVASCIPMFLADRAARHFEAKRVIFWLVVSALFGVAALVLRFYEFPAIHFRWDSNAYGSVVWFLLGFHLMHLSASIVETAMIASWNAVHGMDERRAVDTTVNAAYWYWMSLVWVPLYLIVYFAPRVM